MGWEDGVLQEAVNTCTNPSGLISDCPLFNIVDEATARDCSFTPPGALADEDVEGPLSVLPGGVEITYEDGSPEDALPSLPAVPTLSYTPGVVPTDPATLLPGQIFVESSADAAAAPTTSEPVAVQVAAVVPSSSSEPPPPPPAPTPAPVPEPEPVDPNVSYVSTQYITNGNIVSEILWKEEVVWVTEVVDMTTTVVMRRAEPTPEPGPTRRRRGAHLHGHRHGHH
jgi:hypothetical protein